MPSIKKCKIGIVFFLCEVVLGDTIVFYIQKLNDERRYTQLLIEVTAFLVPSLLALQNRDNEGATAILKDLLKRATRPDNYNSLVRVEQY